MFSYTCGRLQFNRFAPFVTFITLIFLGSILSTAVQAATYYLSPSGADSQPGTSASPWKTFAFAIPKLQPGDTLILRDGTYNRSNSGYLDVSCGTNAQNGTTTQPITVKAENERKAFLQGDGGARPVAMLNCSYWTLEGLRAEDGDFQDETEGDEPGSVVVIKGKNNHITIRRFLVRFNNRYKNAAGFSMHLWDSLVEENELYSFHRHGFQLFGGDNNTFRRNYANSRGHADISGGAYSANGDTQRGDGAFILYGAPDSNNTLLENNISEGNGEGFYSNAFYANANNTRVLGHISLNDTRGVYASSGEHGTRTHNLVIENYAAITPTEIGYLMASIRASCTNCTVLGSQGSEPALFAFRLTATPGDGTYAFTGKNLLAVNNRSTGIRIAPEIQTWSVNGSNSYSNPAAYSPSSGNYSNQRSQDPKLGSCLAWIPDGSPMKGAGAGGTDIGANILYRYENGTLTNQPLWDPATGAFPHGTVVPGVNNIPGQSLYDVHQRLNVNTNGCLFPAGYSNASVVPSPANLRILSVQ